MGKDLMHAPAPYVSSETKADIERMCSYRDDASIARHVGCTVATVARIRSRITRRQRGRPPRQAHMVATKSEIQDSSIASADVRNSAQLAAASNALLRRQMEEGQHSLTADEFYALCFAKGWLEPPVAMNAEG